jgi:glyoxylase-like metal-dependent hydrolase (beta-lactamase superfamily II)
MSEREQPIPLRFAFNRRDLIVGGASLACAGLWAAPGRAQTAPHRFQHGDFDITVLSDGYLALPTTIHGLDAPREDVQWLLKEAGLDSDQVRPATNPVLIRTRSDLILLDTGSGANFQPTAGKLLDNLAAANIDPKSITKVVFTHAHPDHIWGTIGAGGALNFPNAAYYVSAVEWDFWTDSGLMTKLPEQMHVFVRGAQANLGAVKNVVTMVKPGDDIVTGLSVLDSAGSHARPYLASRRGRGRVVDPRRCHHRTRRLLSSSGVAICLRHGQQRGCRQSEEAAGPRRDRQDEDAWLPLALSRHGFRRAKGHRISICAGDLTGRRGSSNNILVALRDLFRHREEKPQGGVR